MKDLRILHIASGDLWAGAEVQINTLLTELAKKHYVHAILLNSGRLQRELETAGIEVTVLPESELSFLSLLKGIRRIVSDWRPQVIHTHRQKENILGALSTVLNGRCAGVRTVHGSSEYDLNWKQKIQVALDHWVGRYLQDAIVSVSERLTQELERIYPRDRIHTIANGVCPEKVRQDAISISHTKDSSAYHVGLAGRMVQVKRVDLFLRMAKRVVDGNKLEKPVRFHIYGDGPLLADYQSLASSLNLDDCVTFHGHCDDIRARVNQLDLMVMTSDHEGMPMTALESLALGVPLVTHAVGGLEPLLKSSWPQGLVYQHDESGYAKAVVEHLQSCEANKPCLPSRYTAQSNAESIVEIYKMCIP